MTAGAAWETLRYEVLRHVVSRSAAAARAYVRATAMIEPRVYSDRASVASTRIAGALDIDERLASSVYRRCIASEAREEADCARVARSGCPLESLFEVRGVEPTHPGPCVYVTLHFGSPILTFLYLRVVRGLPVRALARPIDMGNPLSRAKRRWGSDKVAWVGAASGTSFIHTDARGIVEAREELLAGRALYAAIDVPADVVSRAARFDLFGEAVAVSGGVFRLAALTRVPLIPVVGQSDGARLRVSYGPAIRDTAEAAAARTNAWLLETLSRHPDEWWLWPFATAAEPGVA